jgi:hypothetical protein
MFIITRNGRIITGWKAWAIGIVTFIGLSILFSVIAFIGFGVALTIGAIMMIIVPVAFFGALIASYFNRRV